MRRGCRTAASPPSLVDAPFSRSPEGAVAGSWLTGVLVVALQEPPTRVPSWVRVSGDSVEVPMVSPVSCLGPWQSLPVYPHPLPLSSLSLVAQDTGSHLD